MMVVIRVQIRNRQLLHDLMIIMIIVSLVKAVVHRNVNITLAATSICSRRYARISCSENRRGKLEELV